VVRYKILDTLGDKLIDEFYGGLYFPWHDESNPKKPLSGDVSELSNDFIDDVVDRGINNYFYDIEAKIRLVEVGNDTI
jgi:hypothetical protein